MRPQLLWTRRVLFPKAPLFEVSFLFLTSFFLLKLYTTWMFHLDTNVFISLFSQEPLGEKVVQPLPLPSSLDPLTAFL